MKATCRISSFALVTLTVSAFVFAFTSCAPTETPAPPQMGHLAPAAEVEAVAFVPTLEPTATETPLRAIPAINLQIVTPTSLPTATSADEVTPSQPISSPVPRIFIASEKTNTVQVWQGEPPRFVAAIPVGVFPHNIGASNDERYVATANRWSSDVSIVDAVALTETKRIKVGKAPHDLAWAPDDKRLYISQEMENAITVIDTATWKTLDPIRVDSPIHDLTIMPDGKEMWATTIRYRGFLIIDLATNRIIDRAAYFPHGSHDAYYVPETDEVWVTSSGFIRSAADADPYIVIFDRATRKIKENKPLGQYPFHSVKKGRDGLYLPKNGGVLWFSDRGSGGVIGVNVLNRQVIAQIKTGKNPFHLSFGPNGLLYLISHDDATMSVIDTEKRIVLHTVPIAADPHGVVVTRAP